MAKLHEDWIAFLRLLRERRVRFVIVGAHAVAAHGRPRLTADLDILVEPTLENGRRIVRALEECGFSGLDPAKVEQPDLVVFLGREPFRIDLLTSIDGVTWRSAWEGRLRGELGGVPVAFLGRSQLIRHKKAAGRPKDLADVALLAEGEKRRPRRRPGR
jgi:predicted nucleotidyltransferase